MQFKRMGHLFSNENNCGKVVATCSQGTAPASKSLRQMRSGSLLTKRNKHYYHPFVFYCMYYLPFLNEGFQAERFWYT